VAELLSATANDGKPEITLFASDVAVDLNSSTYDYHRSQALQHYPF